MARRRARLRVGVLISGRGSNLQALIERRCRSGLSGRNRPRHQQSDRGGGVGARRPRRDRPLHLSRIRTAWSLPRRRTRRCGKCGARFIALAGFMRILDTAFVEAWRDRLVNIHPSLLPAFPGLHPQRQALDAGVRFSGCTVHFVRPAVDTGPIIAQAVVPVQPDDDEASLSERILAAEHRLYPMAVRLYAEGRLSIDRRQGSDPARSAAGHRAVQPVAGACLGARLGYTSQPRLPSSEADMAAIDLGIRTASPYLDRVYPVHQDIDPGDCHHPSRDGHLPAVIGFREAAAVCLLSRLTGSLPATPSRQDRDAAA